MMDKFIFSEADRLNLSNAFKRESNKQKKQFIVRCQTNINDFIFVNSKDKLTPKESKQRLEDISKKAEELHKELKKESSKLLYQSLNSIRTPELKNRNRVLKIIQSLAKESHEKAKAIKPNGNLKSGKRQLEDWFSESYFLIFGGKPGKGKGTPFYQFKKIVWEILNDHNLL